MMPARRRSASARTAASTLRQTASDARDTCRSEKTTQLAGRRSGCHGPGSSGGAFGGGGQEPWCAAPGEGERGDDASSTGLSFSAASAGSTNAVGSANASARFSVAAAACAPAAWTLPLDGDVRTVRIQFPSGCSTYPAGTRPLPLNLRVSSVPFSSRSIRHLLSPAEDVRIIFCAGSTLLLCLSWEVLEQDLEFALEIPDPKMLFGASSRRVNAV